jgi:hypothetical protein
MELTFDPDAEVTVLIVAGFYTVSVGWGTSVLKASLTVRDHVSR